VEKGVPLRGAPSRRTWSQERGEGARGKKANSKKKGKFQGGEPIPGQEKKEKEKNWKRKNLKGKRVVLRGCARKKKCKKQWYCIRSREDCHYEKFSKKTIMGANPKPLRCKRKRELLLKKLTKKK